MGPNSQHHQPSRQLLSCRAESSPSDFCCTEHDNVTYHVVRERLIDSEPNRSLRQLESRKLVAHFIDHGRTEREDAQMTLRSRETEQGLSLVFERGHPVAGALLGVGNDVQRQTPNALECCPGVGVETLEVVIN